MIRLFLPAGLRKKGGIGSIHFFRGSDMAPDYWGMLQHNFWVSL